MTIAITIPADDRTFPFGRIDDIPDGKGIYKFYGSNKELLYVGRAANFKDRLTTHLKGNDETSKKFIKKVAMVSCIFVDDAMERDIYETYMINMLRPKFNTHKVFNYKSDGLKSFVKPGAVTQKYFSVEQTAQMLGIEVDDVHDLAKQGKLTIMKIASGTLRVSKDDIDRSLTLGT